jgi:hypothetical protein
MCLYAIPPYAEARRFQGFWRICGGNCQKLPTIDDKRGVDAAKTSDLVNFYFL